MNKGRDMLYIAAILYGLYSIGSGLYGIAMEKPLAIQIIIAVLFLALIALMGFIIYKRLKRNDES